MNKPTVASVSADLIAEQAALDAVVADLSDDLWELPTPSPGWAVRDQIGHLAFFDMTAALAIRDPEAFEAHRKDLMSRADGDELTLGASRAMAPAELLTHWRHHRNELSEAAATCAEDARIEWYGPSMGAKSFLTARLMEAWAHGQDVCDTVGADRPATDRLRHIAQLGYITRLDLHQSPSRNSEWRGPSHPHVTRRRHLELGARRCRRHGHRVCARLLPRHLAASKPGRNRP